MSKLTIFSFIIITASVAGYFCYQICWARPAKDAPNMEIEIKNGESAADAARKLAETGVIKNQTLFRWYMSKEGLDKKMPAGYFLFQPGMSIRSAARVLNGEGAGGTKVLFREGQNIRDYGDILERAGLIAPAKFEETAGSPSVDYRFSRAAAPKDFSAEFDFLKDKPKYVGLEGYLFPDTYFFQKGMAVEQMLKIMLKNFDKKLTTELREAIKAQGKNTHEIIVMASIIEAEAKAEEDRRLISDILWRREAVGMALQADSTVNYITGEKKPAISGDEQKIDSFYNTYKYPGLPPGPINNPGLEAIRSAVHPQKNDYWFFLSGNDGKMHYARTLAEHNENKYKYLKQNYPEI